MFINLTKNIVTEYSKIFIFLGVAILLTLALVFINWILVKKSQAFNKTSVYECGFDNFNSAKEKFTVHFYIIAILFVIFDVEMIFLYAISYSITITKFFGIFILFFFLIILILGLIFEWNNGVLNWNKKTFNFSFFLLFFFDSNFSFNDIVIFVFILFYFISFNLILIFNRTIINLLSLIFFLILGCIFLLVTFKVEFIIYSYLLVYVGGISVLFLFGLMSINQKLEYRKFSLIAFDKLFLNIISSILSFFIYNSVIRGKIAYEAIAHTVGLTAKNKESQVLLADSSILNLGLIPKNSLGSAHELNSNYVLDAEVDAIGQYLFFDSNPYMLLFSMFFLLVSLIVSIELCVINKKN